MEIPCTISCPECRQTVGVWETGQVICANCGAPFEVGVFSPPPEPSRETESVVLKAGELWLTGPWLRTPRQTYLLTDIVGACLTRPAWSGRVSVAALFLLLLFIAVPEGYWLLAAGSALLAGALLLQLRRQPDRFIVSWITRQGGEDRLYFSDRQAALEVLGVLRRNGRRKSAPLARQTGPRVDDLGVGSSRVPASASPGRRNFWPILQFSSATAPAAKSSSAAPPVP